jgi:hypothetical protein
VASVRFYKEVFYVPAPSSPTVRDLLIEKLDALLDECNLVMDNAAFGRTLHDLDDIFCTKG